MTDRNHSAMEALAREVLMRDEEADAINDRVGYDASSNLYVENGWSAPALARAVLRMDALAEMLERESGILRDRGDHPNESGMMAARIRIALDGENA